MNPYASVFCKQHPTFERNCSFCNKSFKLKSKEFFSKDVYEIICPHCDKNNIFAAKQLADDMEKELKKMGIKVR